MSVYFNFRKIVSAVIEYKTFNTAVNMIKQCFFNIFSTACLLYTSGVKPENKIGVSEYCGVFTYFKYAKY